MITNPPKLQWTYVMYNPVTDKLYLRKGLFRMRYDHICLGLY